MQPLAMRRILVGREVVELWESPDARFDATARGVERYTAAEQWVTLFNALTLRTTRLRAE